MLLRASQLSNAVFVILHNFKFRASLISWQVRGATARTSINLAQLISVVRAIARPWLIETGDLYILTSSHCMVCHSCLSGDGTMFVWTNVTFLSIYFVDHLDITADFASNTLICLSLHPSFYIELITAQLDISSAKILSKFPSDIFDSSPHKFKLSVFVDFLADKLLLVTRSQADGRCLPAVLELLLP